MIADSLKFSKRLLNSGFTHQQIEVLQDVINDNLEDLINKKNLDYLVVDLKRDAKFNDDDIKYKMESKIQDTQLSLQREINTTEIKIVKLKLDISIMFAAYIAWMVFLILMLKH